MISCFDNHVSALEKKRYPDIMVDPVWIHPVAEVLAESQTQKIIGISGSFRALSQLMAKSRF